MRARMDARMICRVLAFNIERLAGRRVLELGAGYVVKAYIVMAYVVMAYIVMCYILDACIAMSC